MVYFKKISLLLLLMGCVTLSACFKDKKVEKTADLLKGPTQAKTLIEDPILREYVRKLDDPHTLTYPDLGNQIPTLHTKEEFLDKTINDLTKELMSSKILHPQKKAEIQKRVKVLRELKEEV